VPDLFLLGRRRWQAAAAALGLFVIITGMHTATHTYFRLAVREGHPCRRRR
jgi:hypothetical protein